MYVYVYKCIQIYRYIDIYRNKYIQIYAMDSFLTWISSLVIFTRWSVKIYKLRT